MSSLKDNLQVFRNSFNKLMKSWRKYPKIEPMVKEHYKKMFMKRLNDARKTHKDELLGIYDYVKNFINNIEYHIKYIKIEEENIFSPDYGELKIFEYIKMPDVYDVLNDEDKKLMWLSLQKMYAIGFYIVKGDKALRENKEMLIELFENIHRDEIIAKTTKQMEEKGMLSDLDDSTIDFSDITDDDFKEENCISMKGQFEEHIELIRHIASENEYLDKLLNILKKIIDRIKFPKKLIDKLSKIKKNPLAILNIFTNKDIFEKLFSHMAKRLKNILTIDDLKVIKELQENEETSSDMKSIIGKLFGDIFSPEDLEKLKNMESLGIDDLDKLQRKFDSDEIKHMIEHGNLHFSELKNKDIKSLIATASTMPPQTDEFDEFKDI